MSIPPEWVFTPLNSDRSRTGGDLAAHAFKQSVETFVREVIQNANDQALGRHGAEIVFRLSEYTGEALAAFLDALDWPEFRAHADPVSHEETKGYALRQVLERVHEHDYLLTLSIEDRHTIGLTGEEVEDDSHFCALCRDKLFSHKATKSAGGSYGLGKSVLWTFSGLNTVLFLSRLSEDPATHASPRLIGRTEFPYHRIEGRERSYAGSGWFGERVQDDVYGGERANSVWGEDATAIGARLGLTHDPMTSGTTIMVVGFYDPESDEQMSLEALVERFEHACVENFWPALSRPTRPLQVSVDVDGEELPVTLESNRDVTPLGRVL